MRNIIFFLLIIMNVINIAQGQSRRIGLLINIQGPTFINRNYNYVGSFMDYNVKENDSIIKDKNFTDIFNFYKKNINNPRKEIFAISDSILKENKYQPILIYENLHDDTLFPPFKRAKTDFSFFKKDLHNLQEKYGIDSLIIITGAYGFELEKVTFINGDKRNNIHCRILLVNLENNKIKSNGYIEAIKHIKNWNQPPNYPTLIENYNDLLTKELRTKLIIKITNLCKGKHII